MNTGDTDPLDDWGLGRRAAEGDTTAFDELYRRHSSALYGFLVNRVGRNEARDVLNEVWMKVWKAIKSPHEETHFRGWIFQISRNLLKDQGRRQRNRKTEPFPDDPPIADVTEPPERRLELQERETDLRECLSKLPPEYLTIVIRRLRGEDHGTISESLGIPLGTSHARLSKSMPLLNQCMERKGWTA